MTSLNSLFLTIFVLYLFSFIHNTHIEKNNLNNEIELSSSNNGLLQVSQNRLKNAIHKVRTVHKEKHQKRKERRQQWRKKIKARIKAYIAKKAEKLKALMSGVKELFSQWPPNFAALAPFRKERMEMRKNRVEMANKKNTRFKLKLNKLSILTDQELGIFMSLKDPTDPANDNNNLEAINEKIEKKQEAEQKVLKTPLSFLE
jgi:hypothetical protein